MLTICVTRVPADERIEMAKVIIQNGGNYSAELNKKCTHLISEAPEGDKYKVAQRWGHVHIVTRKWFDQSIIRRACISEESYFVQNGSVSSSRGARGLVKSQPSQGSDMGNLQSVSSSMATDSNLHAIPNAGLVDSEVEATLSQNTSSTFPIAPINVEEDTVKPVVQSQCKKNLTNLNGYVADDSESEDNNMYLSECRVLLAGFEASEMRRLVNIVCKGGGSRYVQFNDKLTHIVVGKPSEIEMKEVKSLASFGIVHVVRITWLEDCDRLKKEIPVYPRHIAQDLLRPKGTQMGVSGANQGRISSIPLSVPSGNQPLGIATAGIGRLSTLDENREEKIGIHTRRVSSMEAEAKSPQKKHIPPVNVAPKGHECDRNAPKSSQHGSSIQNGKTSDVFKSIIFDFASLFPDDRKGEIVQWIKQGQGEVVDAFLKQSAQFTIDGHGVNSKPVYAPKTRYVSSHWIHSCLEDGRLLDVNSHILYSPLPCHIPFPGFENFRFCVSQYDEKDRKLLRNLCFVLGGKLVEKLTKRVTHLLCKFAIGPKYEAARKWGIQSITSEWIYECVKQNKLVTFDLFPPKVVTTQDQEAGLCTTSQFPTQAFQMIIEDNPSQFPSQLEDIRTLPTGVLSGRNNSLKEGANCAVTVNKKARLLEDDGRKSLLSTGVHSSGPTGTESSTVQNVSSNVPDVASAIEDLLEQTSKIHDQKSPGRTTLDETIFLSNCSTLSQDHVDTHSIVGLSKHWLHRTGKKDDSAGDRKMGMYDGFSETQTDSQVVGYEEDLSGRQMLIDKVRTRSSMI